MSKIKFNDSDFDNEFLDMMAGYAEALNLPLAEMMQRMLIRRLAEDRALIDVFETGGPGMVLEFMEFDGMEPKELFKMLYFMKREELEREREEQDPELIQKREAARKTAAENRKKRKENGTFKVYWEE